MQKAFPLLLAILMTLLISSCIQPAPGAIPWQGSDTDELPAVDLPASASPTPWAPATRVPGAPYYTPTPDAPRTMPTLRADLEYYTVQYGDSLGNIALLYNLDLASLIAANNLANPDVLEIGQVITIPAPQPGAEPSDFKIIPDSELVYGPASSTLNIEDFVNDQNGYLETHREKVEEVELTGAQIVARVSREFSVNPRLLLALLEYRSGWVTSRQIDETLIDFPMGLQDPARKGLYLQLAWAAKQLNRGYYLWKINAISFTSFANGRLALLSPRINAGTAAVQYMLGVGSSPEAWEKAVSENGVYSTYTEFFGIPFDLGIEPLIPADLKQPELALPFEPGVPWSFTSGPHAGWGDGSAWAALDFAPPGEELGCFSSAEWVTAVADGLIVRSGGGAVVLDLDGDGLEQTGWTILYMHIETRDRIAEGTWVKTGEHIGHASCEGGFSNGTHVHIARRYNGEWISADTDVPFVMGGWVSAGDGEEYSGTLTKDGEVVYSWNGRVDENQIGY